jgi:hypothetical protein
VKRSPTFVGFLSGAVGAAVGASSLIAGSGGGGVSPNLGVGATTTASGFAADCRVLHAAKATPTSNTKPTASAIDSQRGAGA